MEGHFMFGLLTLWFVALFGIYIVRKSAFCTYEAYQATKAILIAAISGSAIALLVLVFG